MPNELYPNQDLEESKKDLSVTCNKVLQSDEASKSTNNESDFQNNNKQENGDCECWAYWRNNMNIMDIIPFQYFLG